MIINLPKLEAKLLSDILYFLKPDSGNHQVWLVGGSIRDLLRGKDTCYDLDLTLSFNPFKAAREYARSTGSGFVVLDDERHIVRVVQTVDNGKVYTFDLSEFRAADIDGDLKARDFTINAIAAPLFDNGLELLDDDKIELYDPLNGAAALEENRIEACSETLFDDDPLRIMRAFRFAALFNSMPSERLLSKIKKQSKLLASVSGERIRDELFKIFTVSESCKWMRLLDDCGIFEIILPELAACHGVSQNEWHHLDVFDHSMLSLEKLEILLDLQVPYPWWSDFTSYLSEYISSSRGYLQLMKFGCLLHDIGKIPCREVESSTGKISFHRHEVEGAKMMKDICERFRLSSKELNYLQNLVKNHMRPGIMLQQGLNDKRLFRYYSECGRDGLGISLLCLADRFSALGGDTTEHDLAIFSAGIYQIMDEFYLQMQKPKIKPLLNGKELMEFFNLKPGPAIKQILDFLEEAQFAGEVNSKEEAVTLIKQELSNFCLSSNN